MEDTELINSFRAGDKSAFNDLVLRHKDMIFNLCYRFLGDLQDANDTAQDVFIKAYKAIKRFRGESSFSTWLYRIAVNTCKNRVKSREYQSREQTLSIDNPCKMGNYNSPVEIPDGSLSAALALENKERSILIQKAIHTLPKERRMVIILRDIEGLSYDEIVKVTGLTLGTVKSKISRARSELREKLRGVF